MRSSTRSTRPASSSPTSSACDARPAASYPDLVRLRSGRLASAPDAVVMPGSPEQVAALLEICSREGIAVVPFGGGTSVVGGVDAARGPARAPDRARPAPDAPCRGRPRLAHGDARARASRPRGRGRAPRSGADDRPFPAVVRVRDDRRLRGDPVGGPGLERLRPLRRDRDVAGDGHAGRRAAHPGDPSYGGRARRCASSRSAPRACSERSPRSRCGSAGPRRRAATRPG